VSAAPEHPAAASSTATTSLCQRGPQGGGGRRVARPAMRTCPPRTPERATLATAQMPGRFPEIRRHRDRHRQLPVAFVRQRPGPGPAQPGTGRGGPPNRGARCHVGQMGGAFGAQGLGWLVQLGRWTAICRSVQLKGSSGSVGGLQAAKVWIWALTVLGLAGPWSRTTRYTVAWRASSRVVSLPIA
jgi:hypothetical protein